MSLLSISSAVFTEALQLAPAIQQAMATGLSFKTLPALITNPALLQALESIGEQSFPLVAPELRAVAAIVSSYDPNYNKWLQNSLNALVVPSPNLVVDGVWGPKTTAAVTALQKQFGLAIIDGFAGDKTSAVIQALLAKL